MKKYLYIFGYSLILTSVLCSFYIMLFFEKQNQLPVKHIWVVFCLVLIMVILALYFYRRIILKTQEKRLCHQIELIQNGHYENLVQDSNLNIYLNNLNRYVEFQKNEAKQVKTQMKGYIEDIAHQIKTPLTALRVYVETSKDQETMELANQELTRVEMVVDEMIRLAKLEAHSIRFHFSNVFMSDIYDQVMMDLEYLYHQKSLTIDLNYEDVEICVDEVWFCEMLNNILKNCIEFSKEGGHVYIEQQNLSNKLVIRIEDEGLGFSNQELPYIFDRFHTSKTNDLRKQKGMGIGLSVAKEVILAHHGKIYADNSKKGGAMFILEVPFVIGKEKV